MFDLRTYLHAFQLGRLNFEPLVEGSMYFFVYQVTGKLVVDNAQEKLHFEKKMATLYMY